MDSTMQDTGPVDGIDLVTLTDNELQELDDTQLLPDTRARVRAEIALRHRAAYIGGLRALADFLADHPEVPVDRFEWLGPRYYTNGARQMTGEEFLAAVESLDATVTTPPHAEQELRAIRTFGPIEYHVQVPRSLVCEPREVTVTELVLPEQLAAREHKAA